MSEANAPFNRQPSEPGDSLSPNQQESFANPFIDAMKELEKQEHLAIEQVADPSNAGSVPLDDRLPETSSPLSAGSPAESVTLTPGAEDWVASPESTNLTDLISLIQELNQCNTILLDRVSQLEEALERSQNALKAEVKRSQDHPAFADYNPDSLVAAQELSAAQEQILELYHQLEFVHQTSQRQQILVETLTEQLEASQERVAHLEREAALVQQRYNEQSQVLTQYEASCRDLQARLHRQQRYTLQFKAALEKSLEVSSPPFESVADAVAAVGSSENFFLPKVQRIQPWAIPEDYSPTHLPWMKLSSAGLEEEPSESVAQEAQLDEAPPQAVETQRSPQPVRPRLSVVQLPGFGNPIPRPTVQSTNASNSAPAPNLSAQSGFASQDANPSVDAGSVSGANLPNEKLIQKLDAAVQPLADMLAEAMLAEANQHQAATGNATGDASVHGAQEPIAQHGDELASAFEASTSEDSPMSYSSDEALLDSVMADAEDALWQDLARLIDVSTEDIVKASLSGDVAAFESIDFQAVQSHAAETTNLSTDLSTTEAAAQRTSPHGQASPAHSNPTSQPPRPIASFAPKLRRSNPATPAAEPAAPVASEQKAATPSQPRSTPTPTSNQAESAQTVGSNPSWPSPVVYPLRPAKKRRSLAAVDLPSFLQQEPGPLPT
jgi:hypothetical protein